MKTSTCKKITFRQSFFILVLLGVGVGNFLGISADPLRAADLLELYYRNYQELNQKYEDQLSELLVKSQQADDQELTAQIGKRLLLLRNNQGQTQELPRNIQPELSREMAPEIRELHFLFQTHSENYAGSLYLLARKSLTKSPTFGFKLINLVLAIHPDHPKARSLRGYIRQADEWMTPFERDQQRAGKVEHPRYGWLKKSHVTRYEQGERYYRGTWLSATKEAEIRRDFRYAWTVRTEHFQIKTNHSLEKGVELGQKLEVFYDYFKQTYAAFYNSPEQIKQLLETTTGRSKTRSQLYEVNFFRNKEEYVSRLKARVPQIAMTNGLYQLEDRVSYFYYDLEANNDATIFHEATHQLMYESHSKKRDIARDGHFWIVEGIACYAESFRVESNEKKFHYDVGNPQFIRFHWARVRLLEEDYFVPLGKFSRMGMFTYQQGAVQQLQKRYSQASGLAHFYMHYKNGRYRNALMIYMAQIYHSSPRIQRDIHGLDELTGVDYPTLDRQYREYIQEQYEQVAGKEVIQ